MKYLYPKVHYIDQYDLFTIKDCFEVIKFWQGSYRKKDTDEKLKRISPKEIEKGFNYFSSWQLRSTKGERYRRKEETIQQWIDRDKAKQDKLDTTSPPLNIICTDCNIEMNSDDFKHLDYFDDDKPMRVLFFFNCPKCKKRKGVYDNGEVRTSKPELCPKCGNEVKISFKKKKEITITTTLCSSCKYNNIEVDDWEKRKHEREVEEENDRKLLEKYQKEFCFSDKEGKEYIELMDTLEVASAVYDEEVEKYDSPVYQRSLQLKKTSIANLEKLLTHKLEESKYSKLSIDKPEIGHYIIVPFTIQDSDTSRRDRISTSELGKVIKDILEDTNWRLISGSISYRLGYLEGRLQGYEREEDMLKLAGKIKEPDPKPKVDEEKRQKYLSNSIVQLARISGETKGIENMRKRRLEKEPDGFFLDMNDGPYTCGICGENHYGNEIWWNLDGLRCIDCRRNILDEIIPSISHRYDNDDEWFESWQIKSNYGVHSATVEKLRRQGLLVGRDLKRSNGSIYFTVYMVSENKGFLNKYPKIDSKIKVSISGSNGEEIQL